MPRASLTARVAALAGMCAVGAPVAIATTSAAADTQATTTLAGSVAPVTGDNAGVGAVSGTESETIEVWMAGHQQAAQRFVDAVSTPGSPTYHQYLSPSAYTQRFGPSPAQVRAVQSYLTGAGFTQVHASVNDDYVTATAPVSTINQAFSVQIRRYQLTGPQGKQTTIESNDRDLTIPAQISSDILAVTGLNTTQPQPANDSTSGTGAGGSTSTATAPTSGGAGRARVCSQYWAQKTKTISPAFQGLTQAAVAVCGYSAKQIRAAYELTSGDTGKGKTIALIQVGAPYKMFQTLTDYAKANGLPAPRSDQYREQPIGQGGQGGQGGQNKACINGALEEAALDSETAYAIAPGANQLMLDGDECDINTSKDYAQALFNALLAPLTGKGSSASAAIESVSYSLLSKESNTPPSLLKTSHAIALRAAAEGVSLLFASGDAPGVKSPASDPDVTAVGGTTLGIGAHNQRLFETGWSTLFGERTGNSGPWQDEGILLGAGGGASTIYAEPDYQKGIVPRSMALNQAGKPGRAVPDISADADPKSGMLLGLITTKRNGKPRPYETFLQAGTSLATPLVAGMVADAEQGQPRNFGFLNPLLYSLAASQAFHDILPVSPSDPQVDRAYYTQGDTHINNKFAPGFLVGVNDAQDPSGTHQMTAPGYDTTTGLGTPNGRAFITGLRSGTKHPTRRRSRRHRPGNSRGRGSRSTRHHGVRRR
jgi:subtilase family serine protease